MRWKGCGGCWDVGEVYGPLDTEVGGQQCADRRKRVDWRGKDTWDEWGENQGLGCV